MESILALDLMMIMEALPSSGQTWSMLLYYKALILDPLARILLGWEPENGYGSIDNLGLGSGGSGVFFPLPEHRNATVTPDRSKITSRAQLQQLRQSNTTQGISVALDELKGPTALSFRYVHGLVNTGNSCFLNSVLQALSAVTVLPPYLESILSRADELQMEEDDVQVAEALLDTIEALQQPLVSHKSFRPRAIVSALEASRSKDSKSSGYHSNIMNREQQDAQELFQIISSALSSEESVVQKLQATRPLLNLEFLKKLVGLGPDQTLHQVKKQSTNPMIGMLASRLSCMQCGYTEAVRHFTFDNLSLSLPSNHSCSIEDCLKQYINLESLHDVVCRKCSLIATLSKIGNEIKQLDRQNSVQSKVGVQRSQEHYDTYESNGDSYSEGEESSAANDSEDEHKSKSVSQRLTKEERATIRSKLSQRKSILEAAIKSDVERPLPDIRLSKVVSRHCTKQVMLAKPPPVLCLHFIRSQYSNYGTVSKNSCHVNFPEYLDISPFSTTGFLLTQPNLPMSISDKDLERLNYEKSNPSPKKKQPSKNDMQQQQSQQSPSKVLYRLQSIVVHYGGHSYGHFIAYRRKPASMLSKVGTVGLGLDPMNTSRAGSLCDRSSASEDWLRVSDETVEPVTLDHVLRSNPYMCLYEKVNAQEESTGKACGEITSSLSLQAVELGLRKLLARKLKVQDDKKDTYDERIRKRETGLSLDSSRVDLTAITEKEYADVFKEQPKAMSALSRMEPSEQGEDMSDMESAQSHDEDRAWRSFVSSPNSTTPPSPNTSSSDSSVVSSTFTSPIMKQRSNLGHNKSLSLNSLKIPSVSVPDFDLLLDGGSSPESPLSTPLYLSPVSSTNEAKASVTCSQQQLTSPETASLSKVTATSTGISPKRTKSKSSNRRKRK
ncbi:hypothetical protein BGZ46_008393 [Entomortierella lignicola]|nr:hypothetical protein BGZ46_008393 [Entomortierella lignicola]